MPYESQKKFNYISNFQTFLKPSKNPLLTDRYRPISLKQILCKIMEQIIHARLLSEINKQQKSTNGSSVWLQTKEIKELDQLIFLLNAITNYFVTKRHLIAVTLIILNLLILSSAIRSCSNYMHFCEVTGCNHDISIKLGESQIQSTEKTNYLSLIFNQ